MAIQEYCKTITIDSLKIVSYPNFYQTAHTQYHSLLPKLSHRKHCLEFVIKLLKTQAQDSKHIKSTTKRSCPQKPHILGHKSALTLTVSCL